MKDADKLQRKQDERVASISVLSHERFHVLLLSQGGKKIIYRLTCSSFEGQTLNHNGAKTRAASFTFDKLSQVSPCVPSRQAAPGVRRNLGRPAQKEQNVSAQQNLARQH